VNNKGVFLYLLKLVKYCTIPNKRLFLCNMKFRILYVVFALACFFAACKSDPPFDADAQRAIDDDIIVKFLDSAKITATKTSSGLYYQILKDTVGGKSIPLTDTVFIHYVGRMLKTRVLFDSSRTLTDTATNLSTKFILNTAIAAWIEGIPLVAPKGRIRLFVPSALAYGNFEVGTPEKTTTTTTGTTTTTTTTPSKSYVPPNTVLDFDIRLYKSKQPVITPVTTN